MFNKHNALLTQLGGNLPIPAFGNLTDHEVLTLNDFFMWDYTRYNGTPNNGPLFLCHGIRRMHRSLAPEITEYVDYQERFINPIENVLKLDDGFQSRWGNHAFDYVTRMVGRGGVHVYVIREEIAKLYTNYRDGKADMPELEEIIPELAKQHREFSNLQSCMFIITGELPLYDVAVVQAATLRTEWARKIAQTLKGQSE